jgi:cyclohexa-1,5-dienecarbonyl-CoA hydratase
MPLTVEIRDGVAHVLFDAAPLNILTQTLVAELRGTLATLGEDRSVRVLVVSAAGRHFSAGASVEEHLPGAVETMLPELMETIGTLDRFPMPVIFAVQGRCLGGALEVVLAGDMVIAAEGALLGVPEIQLGVLPPAACVQLARLVPAGIAAELVFTGAPIDADAAQRAGLVLRVVAADVLLDEAMTLARSIALHSRAALVEAKRALRTGRGDTDSLMTEVSRIYLEDLMRTADAVEGLESFIEKRPPEWSHS